MIVETRASATARPLALTLRRAATGSRSPHRPQPGTYTVSVRGVDTGGGWSGAGPAQSSPSRLSNRPPAAGPQKMW